jgi:hypothetical protein
VRPAVPQTRERYADAIDPYGDPYFEQLGEEELEGESRVTRQMPAHSKCVAQEPGVAEPRVCARQLPCN